LIPHLVCTPCAEAITFYQKAFGAEELHRMPAPDGRRIIHAAIRIGKSLVFLVDDFPEFCNGKSQSATALQGKPVTLHHYVENCDAAIQRAQDAGATVLMPAADMFWGDRYGVVSDPYGHKWSFGTRIKEVTPEQMHAAMREACTQHA
jgi:PhnB protein